MLATYFVTPFNEPNTYFVIRFTEPNVSDIFMFQTIIYIYHNSICHPCYSFIFVLMNTIYFVIPFN